MLLLGLSYRPFRFVIISYQFNISFLACGSIELRVRMSSTTSTNNDHLNEEYTDTTNQIFNTILERLQ